MEIGEGRYSFRGNSMCIAWIEDRLSHIRTCKGFRVLKLGLTREQGWEDSIRKVGMGWALKDPTWWSTEN